MTTLPNIPGFLVRGVEESDVAAVTDVIAAAEIDSFDVAEIGPEDIAVWFRRPGSDLARDTALVFDGETLAGYSYVRPARVEADVHPAYRGRGIGTALLDWSERRARDLGIALVSQIPPEDSPAEEFLRHHGYEQSKIAWILQISLSDLQSDPAPAPEGIEFRLFDPASDVEITYDLIEAAFGEWPGRLPQSLDEWASEMVPHETFTPEVSTLAFDGDLLVGAALTLDHDGYDEGWIPQVATRSTYRRRGIARALLLRSFEAFRLRGKKQAGLSTDSETGALALYESVGMQVRRSYPNLVKDLTSTNR